MSGAKKELHKAYHDNHYGFPIHNDHERKINAAIENAKTIIGLSDHKDVTCIDISFTFFARKFVINDIYSDPATNLNLSLK